MASAMPSSSKLSINPDLRRAAGDTISALKDIGVNACFVGGYAYAILGVPRAVDDLDVLVLSTTHSSDSLKQQLAEATQSRFMLEPPQTHIDAPHSLWYHVTPTGAPSASTRKPLPARASQPRRFRVGIIVPNSVDHPPIPLHVVENLKKTPIAPLKLLVLLKLQAWSHHRSSNDPGINAKESQDHADILALLSIIQRRKLKVLPLGKSTSTYIPESFVQLSKQRAIEHASVHPESKQVWAVAGLNVDQALVSSPSTIPQSSTAALTVNSSLVGTGPSIQQPKQNANVSTASTDNSTVRKPAKNARGATMNKTKHPPPTKQPQKSKKGKGVRKQSLPRFEVSSRYPEDNFGRHGLGYDSGGSTSWYPRYDNSDGRYGKYGYAGLDPIMDPDEIGMYMAMESMRY